jgi:glycosyltransferase involved in cell wall biosynthesis
LREHRTRVVLADAPRDVRIARYASLLRRRAIAWRYNLHGRRLATDPLQHFLFRGLRHVVHQSRYAAIRLAESTPWLRRIPHSVVPNGFDLGALVPDRARGLAWRDRHGIDRAASLVLTPTPVLAEKSVEVAAAAVARVASERPVTWAVTDTAARLAPLPSPAIPLGTLEPAELHDAMRAADVVLLPAAAELFGNVTAEAMALGCAVVAAAGGGTPEVIGDAGRCFPVGDAKAAARMVSDLLRDEAQRQRLGSAARSRIAEHFSMAVMDAGFDRLVRSLA